MSASIDPRTGREYFTVPPEWDTERVIEAAKAEINWAMSNGPYAAPEVWFEHLPALVALLKATTQIAESAVDA